MTHYTQEEIEDMIDDLRDILSVRVRWNNTYQSVSADHDAEEHTVVIRWYDHVDKDMRAHNVDRRVHIPAQSLADEIAHQREELFDDLSDEDVIVLTETLLNYGDDVETVG